MEEDQLSSTDDTDDRLAVQVMYKRLSDLASKNRLLDLDELMLDAHLSNFCSQTGQILNELRSNGQLCDAVLRTQDGAEFLIHRVIMSGKIDSLDPSVPCLFINFLQFWSTSKQLFLQGSLYQWLKRYQLQDHRYTGRRVRDHEASNSYESFFELFSVVKAG